jgi:MFS family permease
MGRRGTAMVAALGITELISWGVLIYAFSVLLVPMRAELGWSDAQLSAAYATGLLVSGLAAVPVGRWLDRHDPHALMTAGAALTVAVLLGWSAVTSLVVFYALFVLAGLAMATTLYEPAFAIVAVRLPERRAWAVLVLTVLGGLASVVFVPLTGWLVTAFGWRQALVVLAVVVATIVLPAHGLLPRGLATRPGPRPEHARRRSTTADRNRSEALRSRSFRWLTLCLVLSTAGRVAISVHLVAYLTERGYPLEQATLIAGGIGLLQVGGRAAATMLRTHLADHLVYGWVFIAQGLSVSLPLLTTGHDTGATIAVVVFVAVFGLGFGLPELLRGIMVAEYYGTASYASLNGTLALPVAAARALGPAAAGAARTALGDYTAMLIACGLLAVSSGLALVRAARVRRQETYATDR